MVTPIDELIQTYPRASYKSEAPLVKDVWLANHRAVFNRDWTLNTEGSHHFLYWDCNFNARNYALKGMNFQQRCDQIAEKARSEKTIELPSDKKYALCTHYHRGYPFGHWFETLASLRFVPTDDFNVICNKTGGPVATRDIELHLEMIGIDKSRQIIIDPWMTIGCSSELYCPTIESKIGFISKEAISWLVPKYLSHAGLKLSKNPTKLYLSRNFFTHPNPEWTRSVENEDEVWSYLKGLGYTLLKGTENILELIDAFYSAEEIVFPHGSMIYYSIFCSKKPKIVEFISEHRYREDFLYLATINGNITTKEKYKLIKCKADPKMNNIVINMDVLKKEIN
jgi:capsular polysaccharide biosynthesis protein